MLDVVRSCSAVVDSLQCQACMSCCQHGLNTLKTVACHDVGWDPEDVVIRAREPRVRPA